MRRPKVGNQSLRYSEILRVVGQYVEQAGLADIRILETDEGLVLQGRVLQGERAGERDTYQITPEDIVVMFSNARAMRATKI